MTTIFNSLLILSLLFASALQQNCAANLANDQLQTGTYTFVLTSQRVQCYNTSLSASTPAPLQLAYGIGNILNYDNFNLGVDFSLRGRVDSLMQLISFTVVTNNATYGTITASYILVSNRKDFVTGSFIADTNSLLCGSQSTAVIAIPLTTAISASNSTLAILVFVNGIRTQSWLFNIKFQQPTLDYARNQINATINTDSNYPIETLYLSYLIIDLTQLGNSFAYSFTTAPTQSDFSLAGIVVITNSSSQLQYAYFSLNKTNTLSCVGFSCNKCLSPASCLASGGTVSSNQCVKCGQNQVFTAGTGCGCIQGYFPISGACSVCPAGTIYNSALQNCLACGANAVVSNGKCSCSIGYYNISGTCQVCPAGSAFNSLLLTCSSICTGGQQWLNGQCSCASGFILYNGACVAYQTTTTATIGTGSSSFSSCGQNQFVSNGVCKCYSYLVQFNGNCYPCPGNSTVTADQAGCVCNQGYALTSSYTCAPISSTSTTGLYTQTSTTTTPAASTTAMSNNNAGQSSSSSSSSSGGSILWQQCNIGSFYDGSACQLCSSYCLNCFTSTICTSCSSGFSLSSSTTNNIFSSFCKQTCGDSKRYVLACDDGNTVNGDGCSSTCTVENGWACTGGSSSNKDTCSLANSFPSSISSPTAAITLLKNVIFINALYQNVLVSPLPSIFTANGCANCPFLINATLYSAPAGSIANVTFIQGTQYQYVITVIFPAGTNITGNLVIGVNFNKTLASFFTAADMAQNQYLNLNLSTVPVLASSGVVNSVAPTTDQLQGSSQTQANIQGAVLAFLNQ